jgi:hypothetical protein
MVKGGKSTWEIKVLVSGGRGLTGTIRTSVRVGRAVLYLDSDGRGVAWGIGWLKGGVNAYEY